MAYRTAGVFKIAATNTPQPLFGSWVTAVAPANGFAQASGAPLVLTLGTAQNVGNDAAQIFTTEDVWLIDPNLANGEGCRIALIAGNTVTLGGQTRVDPQGNTNIVTSRPHVAGAIGVGTFIIPKQIFNNYLVTFEDGGTGAFLYLGSAPDMTAIDDRFFKLAKTAAGVQPQYYNAGMYSPGNSFDMSELFVMGTAGDLYNVSLNVN
jgi:hypothetical protein